MLLSTSDDLTTARRTGRTIIKKTSTNRLHNRFKSLFLPSQLRRRGTEMHSTVHVSFFPKSKRRPQEVNAVVGAKKTSLRSRPHQPKISSGIRRSNQPRAADTT